MFFVSICKLKSYYIIVTNKLPAAEDPEPVGTERVSAAFAMALIGEQFNRNDAEDWKPKHGN